MKRLKFEYNFFFNYLEVRTKHIYVFICYAGSTHFIYKYNFFKNKSFDGVAVQLKIGDLFLFNHSLNR